jgi:Holliday junction resolvase RusA-like endonuclease
MKYTLTGRVISKKNNNKFWNGRVVKTKAWQRFEETALWQLKSQKRKTLTGPVYVDYCFLMKGKGASDGDNMQTSINDLLEKSGIIENDKQIRAWSGRIFGGQDEYTTEVEISKITEMNHI